MNYGPLEFADYLRNSAHQDEPATVKAARAASPGHARLNRLTIIAGQRVVPGVVTVCEIVAARTADAPKFFEVLVRATAQPVVLVLSSHEAVAWRLSRLSGAYLDAVLLSGRGRSTVTGAGDATVMGIGGFYAFRQGSAEFRHLENQVRMCTGRGIGSFRSFQATNSFDLDVGSQL